MDEPYTSPEEDPFNITPLFSQPQRHRRSSMLNKWIKEQQTSPTIVIDSALPGAGTRSNPYLAYPDLGSGRGFLESAQASAVTLASYDLVDDEDIPAPSTPVILPSPRSSKPPNSLNLRSVSLSLRPASPPPHSPVVSTPKSSRMTFFPLGSGRNTPSSHNRSSSLGTLNMQRESSPPSTKWKRPSVLGYFSSSSQTSVLPSETAYTPSRPSISSSHTSHTSHTCTSSTATSEQLSVPITPSKNSLVDSLRSRRRSYASLLSTGTLFRPGADNIPSMSSLCLEETNIGSSTSSISKMKTPAPRIPLGPKSTLRRSNQNSDEDPEFLARRVIPDVSQPQVAYSAVRDSTLPRVAFSNLTVRGQKKKKKLVVTGVGPGETRKFEGVKRWCESFGEVSQILRMPNGDLHVHFRSADVADTVCRLNAKVFIGGVGRVGLSWYTGTQR
ncbi:hypothetical protein C8J56DRAFT_917996 [Mycena floridula]|nr:hypothetical protein C8J56DRAFT_917996 [Mycena floridula]